MDNATLTRIATIARRTTALTVGTGLSALVWGLIEAHSYVLRRRTIMMDAPQGEQASPSLRILQLTDIHLLPRQRHKIEWIKHLAATNPDMIVLTGDQLASGDALPALLEALEPFANTPGVFVFGSHDYHSPHMKNPLSYPIQRFFPSAGSAGPESKAGSADSAGTTGSAGGEPERDLPWQEMAAAFEEWGWANLNNARATRRIGEWNINFVGVDDPHMDADRFPAALAEAADSRDGRSLTIGVTHAPYRRVLDQMAAEHCSLVFAGHTHGGQVCIPRYGALVSNCDIPPALASGLFRWPFDGRVLKGDGAIAARSSAGEYPMFVNIPTGLGTSPFAPFRVACRPEAVQIDLIVM